MSLVANLRKRLLEAMRADPRDYQTIAQASGYSLSHIQNVIYGKKMNVSLYFIECMATCLNVSPLWLLEGNEECLKSATHSANAAAGTETSRTTLPYPNDCRM